MRHTLPIGLLVVAMLGFPVSAALAQQSQQATSSVASADLFQPGAYELKPGAADRLRAIVRQGQPFPECPVEVDFAIIESGSDTIDAQALAFAREEVMEEALRGLEPAARITSKAGTGLVSMVIFSVATVPDREAPKLDTNSAPRKGSKVKAGDRIVVTMAARDDANGWQSGIKTLQLVADSEGGRFIASENFLRLPITCTAAPLEKRVVATYIVPDNPPPVVRLSTLAEDHAGLIDTDAAEFPTQGDWYGRLEWSIHNKADTSRRPNENRAEFKSDGHAVLTLTYDGQGNLTGTLIGTQKVDTWWWGFPHGNGQVCIGSAPPTPVLARVVGSDTPGRNALALQLVDVEAQILVPWTGGGPDLFCSDPWPFDNAPSLSAVTRGLQPVGDGTYSAEYEVTDPLNEVRFSLTLRQVTE